MRIGEAHALGRQAIEMRRGYLAAVGVVAMDIAVAEIIGEDDDDVGMVGSIGRVGAGQAAMN